MQPLTPAAKVQHSLVALYGRFKFFAPVAAAWKVTADPACPTASTNGPELRYSAAFVDGLSIADTTDLMLHETGHVILGHPARMGNRDPKLYNEAADLSLNDRLGQYMQPTGYIRTHGLFPGEGKYAHLPRGKSAEWYYDALSAQAEAQQQQQAPQPQPGAGAPQAGQGGQGSQPAQAEGKQPEPGEGSQGEAPGAEQGQPSEGEAGDGQQAGAQPGNEPDQGTGSGQADDGGAAATQGDTDGTGEAREPYSLGEITPAPGGDPEEVEREWEHVVARCVMAGKEAGDLPGWAAELADELLGETSAEPWRAHMRRFMTQVVPVRQTYDRPNRRTAWRTDLIFPDTHSKEAAPGCVLTDTSLSMNAAAMNSALTEMEAILATFTRCEVTLRMADVKLYDDERVFHRYDFPLTVPIEWLGRGGTNLAAAIQEIADSRRFKWIAVVSDMRWDAAACPDPGVPVLWITTEDIAKLPAYCTPTFGQVIGPVAA